jgi:hypothetical protein
MNARQRKALTALAVFLSFAFAQVYVHAELPPSAPVPAPPQRPITARLITKNNQPITVNGNSAGTGATILTGVTIETPDQVGATIDLGDAGVVEVEPNSTIKLDFDENGNVRVKVIRGCAVTRKKTNVLPGEMELYTDTASEKTDKKRRHVAGCILPNGQLGALQGAAAAGGGIGDTTLAGLVLGGVGAGLLAAGLSRGSTTSNMNTF